MQPDDTSPPQADHTPLVPAADSWSDVLGAALLDWLRANRDVVREIIALDDTEPE